MGRSNYEDELYFEARKRVKIKRRFKTHRNVYVLTMLFLLTINLMTIPSWMWWKPYMLWVQWPALGWGIGLGFHWLAVVHRLKKFDMDKEVSAEMEMLKRKRGYDKIEEGPDRDIFNMNMNMRNETKEQSVQKKDNK